MRPKKRVLLVAARRGVRAQHRLRLTVWGYAVVAPASVDACLQQMEAGAFDAVLCDGVTGRLLRRLSAAAKPGAVFVLVAAQADDLPRLRSAVMGVSSCSTHGTLSGLPESSSVLREMVRRATARRRGPKQFSRSAEAHNQNDSFGAAAAPRFSPDQSRRETPQERAA